MTAPGHIEGLKARWRNPATGKPVSMNMMADARAGTLAVCLLLELGMPLDGALAHVAAYRPMAGPEVGAGYRLFHDGARQVAEVPVVYNGVLPLAPAATGALSSINGDAEDARAPVDGCSRSCR